jgi:hypothetical protein
MTIILLANSSYVLGSDMCTVPTTVKTFITLFQGHLIDEAEVFVTFLWKKV